jgi:phenylacetate-CoA ligase
LILGIDSLAPHFQCVLGRDGRLDALTVRVEGRPGLTPDQRMAAAATLTGRIKDRIGVRVAVDVVEPLAVDRSEGKAKRLLDVRSKS